VDAIAPGRGPERRDPLDQPSVAVMFFETTSMVLLSAPTSHRRDLQS
jgi:hypothetical protein